MEFKAGVNGERGRASRDEVVLLAAHAKTQVQEY